MSTKTKTPRKLKSAKARLKYVADVIENHPKEWEQGAWFDFHTLAERWVADNCDNYVDCTDLSDVPFDDGEGIHYVASSRSCGAFGCAVGHAVTVTPLELLGPVPDDGWDQAGMVAFGIDAGAADVLFGTGFGLTKSSKTGSPERTAKKTRAKRMVLCLRWLASLSNDDRLHVDGSMVRAFSNGKHHIYKKFEAGKLPYESGLWVNSHVRRR